jgi:sterol desaturase/sphingolipid hydroxylase (fatty acid hydroxylase superfamily)
MSAAELWRDIEARLLRLIEGPDTGPTLALIAATLILTLVIERGRGRRAQGLGVRSLWTDFLYTAFYLTGLFGVVFARPLNLALSPVQARFPSWLRLDPSPFLPELAHIALFYLFIDMVSYWIHRLQHRSPLLWSFHQIHHSQQRLSVLTNFRFHFVDQIGLTVLRFVPLLLVASPRFWPWISLPVLAIELLAHTGFGWTLGPLGRVFVSPRFHGVHHSSDPVHFHHNFGMIFSIWDRVFGSEYRGETPATSFGFPGIPESFFRQLAWPFAALVARGATPEGSQSA